MNDWNLATNLFAAALKSSFQNKHIKPAEKQNRHIIKTHKGKKPFHIIINKQYYEKNKKAKGKQ